MINIELNNENRINFYSHLNISRQTPKQQVVIVYRIEETQKHGDVERIYGGLVQKSDSFCMKGLKLFCVIPFLPIMLLWRLLKCIFGLLKSLYQKLILKWMNYLYLTSKIFLVVLCQKVNICCTKLLSLIKLCYNFIITSIRKLKELINNCFSIVRQCIYDCASWCCNGCCECLSYFIQAIAIVFITIGKFFLTILKVFADFSLRIILKIAEVRKSLQQTYVIVSVSISLIIIAPLALCLINSIFLPITRKIILITKITLLIFKLYVLVQFYQIYVVNVQKLLKFLIVDIFYKHILLNFFYKGILQNFYKVFKLIFYNFVYKNILVKIAKLVKWLALQLCKLIKAGYQGSKFFLEILQRLLKKCWNGILWILKSIFRSFKCVIVKSYHYLIRPILQLLWQACKSIGKMFKTIWNFCSKYILIPIWTSLTKLSTIVITFFANIWKSLSNCFKYQINQQNNQ